MVRHPNTLCLVSASFAEPKARPAFNARFDATSAALRERGITTARVTFVGGDVHHRDEPIDLTAPAADLDIPALNPGNELLAALAGLEEDSPDLAVVFADFTGIKHLVLDRAVRRMTIPTLFVTHEGSIGYDCSMSLFGASRARESHYSLPQSTRPPYNSRVVMPLQDNSDIAVELSMLLR